MRLNVCCGRRILPGYTNVDIVAAPDAPPPDILCDALHLPLPDGCAGEVLCVHGFEHFHRWDADTLLEEWRRLLRPGGQLILELPDLLKCCRNVLEGRGRGGKHPDQAGMWGLFGDPRFQDPFMCHRWAWSPATLGEILRQHGFSDVVERETQFHPAGRAHRDMRIEAQRGAT